MKNIIAIFILSLLMIVDFPTFGSDTRETEKMEELKKAHRAVHEDLVIVFPPDPGHDLTEFQMGTLREIILLFKQALGRNLYEELFPHNGTMKIHSEIINFKNLNISFEIFQTEDDMFFLYADAISCDRRKHLLIKLKQKKTERDKMIKVTGNLKYRRSQNSTQTCEVFFGLEFELLSIRMKFHLIKTKNVVHKTSKKPSISGKEFAEDAPTVTEWKEYSCDEVNEEQRQAIRENTSQAMMYWIEKQLLATQLPFQSIRDKCERLQNISTEMENKNFVYLKSNHTTSANPWKSNHSEIIIEGLHDFNLRMHQVRDTVQYEMEFSDTTIAWAGFSSFAEKLYFMPHRITLNGSCTEFTVNVLGVKLHETEFQYRNERPKEKIEILETLIVHGIDRELQNDTPSDATQSFVKTIRKIRSAFLWNKYKNTFQDSERRGVYFSNITRTKDAEHIKCTFHKSLEVDELNYNKIAAHIKLQFHAGNETKEIFAFFELKNRNFTFHNLLFSTKIMEAEIKRNFQIANKTITILSNHNYERKQRTSIGKTIYDSFVEEMTDQIINAGESFRSLSDICTDPLKEYRRLHPYYQQNRKKYYVSFASDWTDIVYPFTSRFVEVIIDGAWNFKSIEVGYIARRLVLVDLQIENIAGSIKQTRVPDANETVKLNFFVKNLNLYLTNRTIRVEVQQSDQNSIIPTTLHNSSLIPTTAIMEKIQRSIASFIQLRLYGIKPTETLTQKKKLLEQTAREATRNESLPHYDISSVFLEQFVLTLKNLQNSMNKHVFQINNHPIKDANDIPDEMKRLNVSTNHSISLNDVKISLDFPIAREETCNPLDHSQVQIVYNVTLQLKGMVTIMSNSSIALADISFLARNRSTILTFKNGNMLNGESQLDVVCENMEVRIKYQTKNKYKNVTNEETDLKTKLKQISIAIIKKKFLEIRTWFSNDVNNFCEIPHIIAANETYSDLVDDSQKYFYLTEDNLQKMYSKTLFHYIRLYGLFNFKLLKIQKSEKEAKFQFEAKNLTARIIWNYISDNMPTMEVETLDVQIETIVLIGKTTENSDELQFFAESTVLLSPNQGAIQEQKTLTKNLNDIVMSTIQSSIKVKYKYTTIRSWDYTDFMQRIELAKDWRVYGNPLGDMTELIMNSLREVILIFRQAFGRNLFEELFLQSRTMKIPSERMNMKNLPSLISIFQTSKVLFLYTDDMECQPREYLRIKLKLNNSEQAKMIKLTGNLKYPQLENSIHTCQVNFSLEFEFLRIKVKFRHLQENDVHETSTDMKVTEWNEHSCDDIDEEQHRIVRENTLQSMRGWVEKELFTNSKLPFQLIREKCEQLLNNFNEAAYDYYVHLGSDYNAATFPWNTKKNDILIRGLHNFTLHMHNFNDAVQYKIEFPYATIIWIAKAIFTQNFISNSQRITMNGTFKEFIHNSFDIKLPDSQFHTENEDENITPTTEQLKNLEVLIAYGIKQELRNNKQRDVTATSHHIIRQAIDTFTAKRKIFENPFHDNGRKATDVFNITSDVLQNSNSENITCSFNNSLQTSALSYKEVTALVNLQYQEGNEVMKKIFALVKMKNFNSTPHNLLLDTKELKTEIERNFNISEKTITILSTNRYQRKDRIAIGKNIFGSFVKEMKDRIIRVAKSTIEISDTCKDPMNKFRRLYSNYQENYKKYYIQFPADWNDTVDPFTNPYVRIIINGTWNFESINASYSDEIADFIDLRIENITGSIKQIDASDLAPAVQLNFNIKCLSIKKNGINRRLRVEVPDPKQFFITSATPHSNSSLIRTNVIMKKFQESIASFIQQQPFNDQNWNTRMIQDMANQTAMETMQNESQPQYDISSLFLEKLVETLGKLEGYLKKQGYQINNHHLKDSNKVPNEMKQLNESSNHSISLNYVKISWDIPITYEVTCEPPNHTQIIYNIKLQLTGVVTITNNSNFVLANIFFFASARSTIIPFENDGKGELRFDVACENMEIQLKHLSEKIYKFVANEKKDLKNKLEQISIEIIKTKSSEAFQLWFNNDDVINFCEIPHIAANKTYFNLLNDSRRYFYLIKDRLVIHYDDQLFYEIRLYGLFNFNSLKIQYSEKETKFEFQASNVTTRIAWKRDVKYVQSMKYKEMDVEIEAIVLRGIIIKHLSRIDLFPNSTVRLKANQGNTDEQKTLTENLNFIIMYSFQQSMQAEYEKILDSASPSDEQILVRPIFSPKNPNRSINDYWIASSDVWPKYPNDSDRKQTNTNLQQLIELR